MKTTSLTAACLLASAIAWPVHAHETKTVTGQGKQLSFFNTQSGGMHLSDSGPTTVASVTVELESEADVLVQFTSEVAAADANGCPCSVRASLKLNDRPAQVVKRVNVGTPAVQSVSKYDQDRENIDGSYVFSLPAGEHTIALAYQQAYGTSKSLEVFYPNLQALAFSKR